MPLPVKCAGFVLLTAIFLAWQCGYFKAKETPSSHIFVEKGWENVGEEFKNFQDNGIEQGGNVAVYHKGKLVVDIKGGKMAERRPWNDNTLTIIFSITKSLAAMCVASLVDRGYLDYNEKVAKYWPNFAQNGKQHITVNQLVSHASGLQFIDPPGLTLRQSLDVELTEKTLAKQKPAFEPGTQHGYNVLTFGMYLDHLIRHVDPKKRGFQDYFTDEIAKKFDLDIHVGLPRAEFHRLAKLNMLFMGGLFEAMYNLDFRAVREKFIFTGQEVKSVPDFMDYLKDFHNPDYLEVPSGSVNTFTNAKSLARLYSILATKDGRVPESKNSRRILSEKGTAEFLKPIRAGIDAVMLKNVTLGRGVIHNLARAAKPETGVGHLGAGGQLAFADPENQISFVYLTNYFKPYSDERNPIHRNLLKAVYAVVDKLQ